MDIVVTDYKLFTSTDYGCILTALVEFSIRLFSYGRDIWLLTVEQDSYNTFSSLGWFCQHALWRDPQQ